MNFVKSTQLIKFKGFNGSEYLMIS